MNYFVDYSVFLFLSDVCCLSGFWIFLDFGMSIRTLFFVFIPTCSIQNPFSGTQNIYSIPKMAEIICMYKYEHQRQSWLSGWTFFQGHCVYSVLNGAWRFTNLERQTARDRLWERGGEAGLRERCARVWWVRPLSSACEVCDLCWLTSFRLLRDHTLRIFDRLEHERQRREEKKEKVLYSINHFPVIFLPQQGKHSQKSHNGAWSFLGFFASRPENTKRVWHLSLLIT